MLNAQYSIGELDVLNNPGVGMLIQVTLLKLIKYYDKALAIDPDNTDALDNRVFTLSNIGNQHMSLKYLNKALAPGTVIIHGPWIKV